MLFARKKLDPINIYGSVKALSAQCTEAWVEASKVEIPDNYRNLSAVVMCGMGGPGLGARVIESVYKDSLKVPLIRINDYPMPSWLNYNTLVIASSYSGTTEETLANVEVAIAKKSPWIAIGTGGTLIDKAKNEKAPFYQINPVQNPSNQPRMAIGYSIIGQMVLAHKSGLIYLDQTDMGKLTTAMGKVTEAAALDMAKKLKGKEVVFVSADFLDGSTHVWNNQTNENAKTFTSHVLIPELNHHLLESLAFPKANRKELAFVFVNSPLYPEPIRKRFQFTKEVVDKNKVLALEYVAQSENKIAQAFEVIQFGAYVAFFLSRLNRIDPGPIPWVDYFKKKMVES